MSIIDETEYQRQVIESLVNGTADEQTDGQGQIVIYTGIFFWEDGTLHSEPEEIMEVGDDEYQLSDGE